MTSLILRNGCLPVGGKEEDEEGAGEDEEVDGVAFSRRRLAASIRFRTSIACRNSSLVTPSNSSGSGGYSPGSEDEELSSESSNKSSSSLGRFTVLRVDFCLRGEGLLCSILVKSAMERRALAFCADFL